jgi:hypothetical protein
MTDRHAWKNYRMPAPEGPIKPGRQLVRKFLRAKRKREAHQLKMQRFGLAAENLYERVSDRRAANGGQRTARWPSWWHAVPGNV